MVLGQKHGTNYLPYTLYLTIYPFKNPTHYFDTNIPKKHHLPVTATIQVMLPKIMISHNSVKQDFVITTNLMQ